MRHTIALLVLLGAGCAHQEQPYSFLAQAPPTAVAASAQAALGTVIAKSPTRLVTPWQIVGRETVVQSASGGEFEPIIDRRRFAILLAPNGAGTVVTVRQDFETC